MSNYLTTPELNLNPFIYFHGTSSALSEKIEKEGILGSDYKMMWLAQKAMETYNQITNYSLDGCNELDIYNGFDESITRISFAHNDMMMGNKNRAYLAYSDAQAISYSQRLGGEFYSGLFYFVNHLEWITNNYEEFDSIRKSRFMERFGKVSGSGNLYTSIPLSLLKYQFHNFRWFKEEYAALQEQHEHGVIYVCELAPEKIMGAKHVQPYSISVDSIAPDEIIDKIVVTKEIAENHKLTISRELQTKHEQFKHIQDEGSKMLKLMAHTFKQQILDQQKSKHAQ